MNSVILIGRLTKDPDIRYTQNGMAIARFNIAIDRPPKQDGTKETDFPSILAFGKTAENCEKYLSKGSKVAVEGRIQTGSYTNKDGNKVYTTDVAVARVEFLDSRNAKTTPQSDENVEKDTERQNGTKTPQSERQTASDGFEPIDDDDIPF